LTLSVAAWVVMGAAAFHLVTTEQKLLARRAGARAFDGFARRATDAVAKLRDGQQAYIAAGQDPAQWEPRVAALARDASAAVDALRSSTGTMATGQLLLDASAALTELGNIDKRVREYLTAGEPLMASDIVFSEGRESADRVAAGVEAARAGEASAVDAAEAAERQREAYILGAAVAWTVLVTLLLAFAPAARRSPVADVEQTVPADRGLELPLQTRVGHRANLHAVPTDQPPATGPSGVDTTATLVGAATMCTELGQVRDLTDLEAVLSRAARVLDATGLIVWVGGVSGSELQPVLAHGYGQAVLGRMKPIPRGADNAVAAAYREGALQVVAARPGSSLGAVAVPLLSVDGCVGALTAEIDHAAEASPAIHAAAQILAAQLANILPPSAQPTTGTTQSHVASA
jgi:hypothetical protein